MNIAMGQCWPSFPFGFAPCFTMSICLGSRDHRGLGIVVQDLGPRLRDRGVRLFDSEYGAKVRF